MAERALTFRYTNWRGETSTRRAAPIRVFWGSNKWHEEPQHLMEAWDYGKNELRTFALRDCDFTACDD